MKPECLLLLAAVILLSSLQLSRSIWSQEITASDEYCEMVSLWYQSGGTDVSEGDFGWPDYRGIYEEACQ